MNNLKEIGIVACFIALIGVELYAINSVNIRLEGLAEIISVNETSTQSLSLEDEAVGGDEPYTERDIECLALNAYFEARNEPRAGKIGVTQVVLNRVESDLFPNDVCEVIYQAETFANDEPRRNRCQFSWYCDGRSDIPRNWKSYTEIFQLVSTIVRARSNGSDDITNGSLFYHADYVNPLWNRRMEKQVQLGRHLFWKPV